MALLPAAGRAAREAPSHHAATQPASRLRRWLTSALQTVVGRNAATFVATPSRVPQSVAGTSPPLDPRHRCSSPERDYAQNTLDGRTPPQTIDSPRTPRSRQDGDRDPPE